MNLTTKLVAALMLTASAFAQTAAEQLRKGIFAQESQGKIDDAINIYRQLANSTLTPREIAAQAQYRLSQSLLQKGDIANATREMERLERDFSEYRNLISSLASQSGIHTFTPGVGIPPGAVPIPNGAVPPPSPEKLYNMNSRITVQGKVKQIAWVNPTSWLTVDVNGKDYRIQLASPNTMLKGGATRDTFKLGDDLVVQGANALDGSLTLFGVMITSANGQTLFDRAKADRVLAEILAEQQLKGK
jgi:hypothetical protein